jgi:hypothetical protein
VKTVIVRSRVRLAVSGFLPPNCGFPASRAWKSERHGSAMVFPAYASDPWPTPLGFCCCSGLPTIRPECELGLGACTPNPLPACRRSTHLKPLGILKSSTPQQAGGGVLAVELTKT